MRATQGQWPGSGAGQDTGHAALRGTRARPWQLTAAVLTRFGHQARGARRRYRAFVAEDLARGRRPELQGGGLVRSVGGWQAVGALRRGREAYAADERVLGSSAFVEELLREVNRTAGQEAKARRCQVDLPTLVRRVGQGVGLAGEVLLGRSRARAALRARQLLAYVWVERLGRPASELARVVGQTRGNVSLAAKRGAEVARAWREQIPGWCR